jgi:hypothetical protein
MGVERVSGENIFMESAHRTGAKNIFVAPVARGARKLRA